MSEGSIRVLIASGFFMLLVLLRLESERFGAAEYDEPGKRGVWTRIAWYALGLVLLGAIYVVHPRPHDVLLLLVGHRSQALLYGVGLAALGTLVVAGFARFWYGEMRFPAARAYPGAALNAVGTAVIDEATFRGVLLGTMIWIGVPQLSAVLMAAIAYVLVTRLAAPGRHPVMMLLALGLGLLGGWATVVTGGIGAAIIAHAGTSFALFVFTGHAGQVAPAGREPEEVERRQRPPEGWQYVWRPVAADGVAGRGDEPAGADVPGPSGYGNRRLPAAARDRRSAHAPGGLMGWISWALGSGDDAEPGRGGDDQAPGRVVDREAPGYGSDRQAPGAGAARPTPWLSEADRKTQGRGDS
ncbi:MAG: CPBP family glutamic-type intramembrane protease [Candidatus Limnocylindrales bacterium]